VDPEHLDVGSEFLLLHYPVHESTTVKRISLRKPLCLIKLRF
jgi:hypothetical protein